MSGNSLSLGRAWFGAALLGLASFSVPACSSSGASTGSPEATPGRGDLRGPCYPNSTCNSPYTCVSEVCVDLGGEGGKNAGGSGVGATSGSAGTGNKGGSAGTGGQGGSGAQGGTGAQGGSGGQGGSGAQGGSTAGPGGSNGGSLNGCAGKVYVGKQAPVAMLILLDRSSSMTGGKWAAAADALNAALESSVFDSTAVGLLAAPGPGNVSGPECLFNLPVPCVVPSAPQVSIQDVGAGQASDVGSLRAQLKSWLQGNAPQGGGPFDADASPLYEASQKALEALKAWPKEGKRILLVVSDGSLSCTSLSNRSGFQDGNGCPDWENPQNLIDLFGAAHDDPAKPVYTFVVGVPGADSYDPSGTTLPPYHMRTALSAIAYAGAPELVDPACTGKTFAQGDPDPSLSCHFDMTLGGFDANALAANIAKVRGKALGCAFELPEAEGGGQVDLDQVNVQINVGGGPVDVPKRSDPNDACAGDYCWDYNAEGKIELIGKSCQELSNAPKAAVSVIAGCTTIIK